MSYSHLVRLEDRGEDSVFPEGSDHNYAVRELLQGVNVASMFDVFRYNSEDKPVVKRIGEQLKARGLSAGWTSGN